MTSEASGSLFRQIPTFISLLSENHLPVRMAVRIESAFAERIDKYERFPRESDLMTPALAAFQRLIREKQGKIGT